MDQFEMQRELRKAMSAKTSLLAGGLLLIFTAVTSTVMNGVGFIMNFVAASKGNAEIIEVLEKVGISKTLLCIAGICFILVGVAEIFAGVCGFRFNNRLDRADFMMKVVIVLLAVEAAMQVFLFCIHLMSYGMLFSALVIPLFMLWGTWRLRKLAKADPDRIYVVQTRKDQSQRTTLGKKPDSQKSMRERAMLQPKKESEETARESEESEET